MIFLKIFEFSWKFWKFSKFRIFPKFHEKYENLDLRCPHRKAQKPVGAHRKYTKTCGCAQKKHKNLRVRTENAQKPVDAHRKYTKTCMCFQYFSWFFHDFSKNMKIMKIFKNHEKFEKSWKYWNNLEKICTGNHKFRKYFLPYPQICIESALFGRISASCVV